MTHPILLAASIAALAAAAPARRTGMHPEIGSDLPADACVSCHAERTPEVVKRWESGSHGVNLVKCFVCHGSTGKDFTRRPAAARCGGCHPDALAAVAPARRGRSTTCFDCHAPHDLAVAGGSTNPHASR